MPFISILRTSNHLATAHPVDPAFEVLRRVVMGDVLLDCRDPHTVRIELIA